MLSYGTNLKSAPVHRFRLAIEASHAEEKELCELGLGERLKRQGPNTPMFYLSRWTHGRAIM